MRLKLIFQGFLARFRRKKKLKTLALFFPPEESAEHWGTMVTAARAPNPIAGGGYVYLCEFCGEPLPLGGLKLHLQSKHKNQGRFSWELISD